MAHWLAALAALVEDLNLVRSVHMASSQLPIILIPGAPVPSSDLYGYMNAYRADTNAKTHTYAHNINLTTRKIACIYSN